MTTDVVVIGAGSAGLSTAAILASEGKRVTLVEQGRSLGGRSRHWRHRGHEIGLGSHLVEDPGDSLTLVCDLLGVPLEHSRAQRLDAVLGPHGLEADPGVLRGRRQAGPEALHRGARRDAVRGARPVGPRLAPRVDGPVHLRRGRLPRLGGDLGARADHRAAVGALGVGEPLRAEAPLHEEAHGGLLVLSARRLDGALERDGRRDPGPRRHDPPARDGRVACSSRTPRCAAWSCTTATVVEAREVVVTAPVWNLPRLFDDGALPWDLLARIELLRKNKNRACWLGWWIAAKEPVIAMTEREMASFFSTPRDRPARLHAQLHGLRPVGLAAGRVPHVRRRRVRRRRALRRPRLARAEVPRAVARHRGDAPDGEARALDEEAPRDHLRRDQQARPRRARAAGRRGARRRRALARRRHDALARGRDRQGRPHRDHRRRGRPRAVASPASPTPSATDVSSDDGAHRASRG